MAGSGAAVGGGSQPSQAQAAVAGPTPKRPSRSPIAILGEALMVKTPHRLNARSVVPFATICDILNVVLLQTSKPTNVSKAAQAIRPDAVENGIGGWAKKARCPDTTGMHMLAIGLHNTKTTCL
jgi:hypothetical protein